MVMKKLLSLLVAATLVIPSTISVIPASGAMNKYASSSDSGIAETSDSPVSDFEYSISDDSVTITKYIGNESKVITPVTIEGKPVIEIASSAFSNCKLLTAITIPDGIKTIGNYAFNLCDELVSVKLPNTIVSIGNHAFSNCSKLTNIELPLEIQTIENHTFYKCSSLSSVTIPNKVTSIGIWAFANCSSLESIVIPDSVESIGSSAFSGCVSLKAATITVPVSDMLFSGCTSLETVTLSDNVTSIGVSSFSNCQSLNDINLPETLCSIGNTAFLRCYALKQLYVPRSVESFGTSVFKDCSDLTIVCYENSSAHQYATNNNILYELLDVVSDIDTELEKDTESEADTESDTDTKSEVDTESEINTESETGTNDGDTDEYVCNENDFAYELYGDGTNRISITGYTGNAKKIRIPDKIDEKIVYDIEAYSFDNSMVESVIVPKSVNLIAKFAFNKCNMLESVYLPGNVTLPYTSSVITFGGYVRKVSEEPFQDCPNLTLYCPENADKVVSYADFNYIPYKFINYSDIYGSDETEENTDLEEQTDGEKSTDSQTDFPDVYPEDKPNFDTDSKPDNPPDVFPPDDKSNDDTDINPNIHTDTDSQTELPDNPPDDYPNVDTDSEPNNNTNADSQSDNLPNVVDPGSKPDDKQKVIGIFGEIDGDGKVTSADSLLILRQSVGLENFTDIQKNLADVDGDGKITSADALDVLRFSVGLSGNEKIGKSLDNSISSGHE